MVRPSSSLVEGRTPHASHVDWWLLYCMVRYPMGDLVYHLFHIASTNEPPVIPPRLSKEGRDFLIRCFNRCSLSPLLVTTTDL